MMAAVLVFVVLAGIFGLTYYFNKKTPVPEGCEEARRSCEGCAIQNCANRIKEDQKS